MWGGLFDKVGEKAGLAGAGDIMKEGGLGGIIQALGSLKPAAGGQIPSAPDGPMTPGGAPAPGGGMAAGPQGLTGPMNQAQPGMPGAVSGSVGGAMSPGGMGPGGQPFDQNHGMEQLRKYMEKSKEDILRQASRPA